MQPGGGLSLLCYYRATCNKLVNKQTNKAWLTTPKLYFLPYFVFQKRVYVEDLTEEIVSSPEEALKQMHRGESKMQNYVIA